MRQRSQALHFQQATNPHSPLVVQFERGSKPPSESILQALKLSLEAAGIDFIPENGGGPGVRLSRNH
ncbi:XRE family transcriptional regulator [Mesorhizobium sp. M4B.F.Ca.ET.190.01.1.1]|nr:XRE family transcriptional regulator [Mesorhizobium sp. M4B.F.Ca.ET.200.01.1.1]TGS23612.1 XRE family transcriptional regulator [Mesorhizobium sp. M4B.F.Ca.ET.190.01.1.1]TGT34445.1 XRE family transcriptional regulator [Mesorhizobium sp. M4B.F.Ca.ET.172.01.1.1]